MPVNPALAGLALGRAGRKVTVIPRKGDARPTQEVSALVVERTLETLEEEVPFANVTFPPDARVRVGDKVRYDNREIELNARLSSNSASQTWRGNDVPV